MTQKAQSAIVDANTATDETDVGVADALGSILGTDDDAGNDDSAMNRVGDDIIEPTNDDAGDDDLDDDEIDDDIDDCD